MKKIGIVTLYGEYNIGNKLQNYAVCQIYRKFGYSASTIYYDIDELEATGSVQRKYKVLIKEIFLHLGFIKGSIYKYSLEKERKKNFKEFSEKYLFLAEKIIFEKVPKNLKEKYDFFSVGSDQVWRNWGETRAEIEYFLLRFADNSQKICISPSIGRDSIPNEYLEEFRRGLADFTYLSCREELGAQLIKDITGRSVEVLIDPTMALDRDEWKVLMKKPTYSLPDKYILVYMLGDKSELVDEKIRRYSNQLALPVVNIYNRDNAPEYYKTGPSEFLYLVSNATLISTNSYHGCAFSVLFNNAFVCFEREDLRANMKDRLFTLLSKFSLTNRYSNAIDDQNILKMDFEYANKVLEVEKKKLYRYITMNLTGEA